MDSECEKYARIRDLIKTHPGLPSSTTQEALLWLDDITIPECQTDKKPNWDMEIE